ncbi:MAG: class I SAM-dependent methyltransferase [Candidatus Hydrogenedentes bacterium]|nr:class I SAM-dependent methyltransferase [Candidatus Hydrogenedentota bacterium]
MKSLIRPFYRLLRANPLFQRVLRHELAALGAQDWSAAIVDRFIHGPSGADYGVGAGAKAELAAAFRAVTQHVPSGTAPIVHVVLAEAILSIPRETEGVVVECGCWKGASSASLSRVCALTGRRLVVCDSFAGLPGDGMRRHVGVHTGVYGYYREGMFAGALDEVQANIRAWGAIEVCDFVPGFFSESLKALHSPVALGFLDVDLESSMRDCVRAIWPLLVEGGYLYSDDAGDLDVVKVFFDTAWWRETLDCSAPGFVGSGCGLPLSPSYSALGYARKLGAFEESAWKRAGFLHYPE